MRWRMTHCHPAAAAGPDECSVQAIGISLWASSKGSGNPDQSMITTGSIITLSGLTFQVNAAAIATESA